MRTTDGTCLLCLFKVKRVIQGEAPGDLVLEEDLKTGGCGIPVGQEGIGAGLDGLRHQRPKGTTHVSGRSCRLLVGGGLLGCGDEAFGVAGDVCTTVECPVSASFLFSGFVYFRDMAFLFACFQI